MAEDRDPFALGMSEYDESAQETTPSYDAYQLDLIREHLGNIVLEVGAGTGRISRLIAEEDRSRQLVLVEPSPTLFPHLRERMSGFSNVELRQAEFEDAISSGEGFDTVVAVHVLEHIEDDQQAVRRWCQALVPGGRLILLVPAIPFLFSRLDAQIGHFRRYLKGSLSDLFGEIPGQMDELRYTNAMGILPWLIMCKWVGLDYQSSRRNKAAFFGLAGLYSSLAVPVVQLIEKVIKPPIGLQLLAVFRTGE